MVENAANSMPAPVSNSDDKPLIEEAKIEEPFEAALQQQQALLNSNICETHFPEPIIYMSEKPLCKKCIPEHMEAMK